MALDLIASAALVRSGEATALELLDAAIARIEAARDLNAVICDLFERAREQASKPLPDGPLAGAPFLLKDLGASLAGTPERMARWRCATSCPRARAWSSSATWRPG